MLAEPSLPPPPSSLSTMATLVNATLHMTERKVSPLGKGPCSEPVVDSENVLFHHSATSLGRGSVASPSSAAHLVADSGVGLSGLVSARSLGASDGMGCRDGGENEVFSEVSVDSMADVGEQNGEGELQAR